MTVNEIKASNKQEVKAPTSVHDMTTQLKMLTIANDIFFGTLSVGSQCLRSLQSMIDRHRSSFKAREHLDEEFSSLQSTPDSKCSSSNAEVLEIAATLTTQSSTSRTWSPKFSLAPSTSRYFQPSK
jgi:hypothetical protein